MHRYADMLFTLFREQAGPFCSELWQHLISAQERDVIEGLFAFEKLLKESNVGLEMSVRHRRNEHFQGHPGIQTNAKHACKTLLDLSYGNLVDDTSLLIAGEPSGSTQGVHRPKEGQTRESGAASSPIDCVNLFSGIQPSHLLLGIAWTFHQKRLKILQVAAPLLLYFSIASAFWANQCSRAKSDF